MSAVRLPRLPRDLRRGHDDSIACSHRDVSVCAGCAARHAPALVEVASTHFWVPDQIERAELLGMLRASEARRAREGIDR